MTDTKVLAALATAQRNIEHYRNGNGAIRRTETGGRVTYDVNQAAEALCASLNELMSLLSERSGNRYPMSPEEIATSTMAFHLAGADTGFEEGFNAGINDGSVNADFVKEMIEHAVRTAREGS